VRINSPEAPLASTPPASGDAALRQKLVDAIFDAEFTAMLECFIALERIAKRTRARKARERAKANT